MNFKFNKKSNDTLEIIHSSDIHGYLFNTDYIKTKDWGLLTFYNYLKQLKQENKNVLILDSGDLIQGSPLTYYLQKNFNNYNPIIDLLNDLNYDIVTLGNHEFNYGFDYLSNSYKDFNGDIINANVLGLENYLNVKKYKIIKYKSFKVGIIGFTTSYVPNWEQPKHIKGLIFESIIDSYKKYEKELQENSDFIICLYHGGFETEIPNLTNYSEKPSGENEASQLIKTFNSIDLLLTGHQHQDINLKINNTLCRQPINNAQTLTHVTVDIKKKEIIASTSLHAEDFHQNILKKDEYKSILNKIDPKILNYEKKTQNYLNQIIGTLDKDILITDHFQARYESHPLINLINKVQLELTEADISAVSLFDTAVGFKKDISIRDLIANYPFPNTLVVLEITKPQLIEALEVSASYFEIVDNEITINKKFVDPKPQHFHYDMFDGLDYQIDLTKPIGSRIKINRFFKNINEAKIKIVINNFRASNVAWYPMYKDAKVIKEIQYDMVELLINYISQKKHIIVDDKPRYIIKK